MAAIPAEAPVALNTEARSMDSLGPTPEHSAVSTMEAWRCETRSADGQASAGDSAAADSMAAEDDGDFKPEELRARARTEK